MTNNQMRAFLLNTLVLFLLCYKWDLHATNIGEVVEGSDMEVFFHGEKVASIPAKKLADEAPIYNRE
ncbi:hypothetical protein ACFL3D_06010, partial [Candidatus Omnitrophota bacterium]